MAPTDPLEPRGDDVWYTESLHEGYRASIQVRKTLFSGRSGKQELVIAESVRFGTLVMLDGITQLTSADEYVYHEMLSHVPILAHGAVRDVLIIGGGDGGMAEEILKHQGVRHITLVEIDPWVVGVSKRHLKDVNHGAFDDPRLELVIGDGNEYVAATEAVFDLIVVDSTDPQGPAKPLFLQSFYAGCRRILRPGGVIVTQNGIPFFQAAELEETMRSFAKLFADGTCYLAAVPTYVGGFMAFGWGTDNRELRGLPVDTLRERLDASGIETRYYTPEVHLASFALPRFILDIVERGRAG
jgi:spermidine synthase